LRIGGFATGIRVSLLPILAELAERHPAVDVVISEYEPIEALHCLPTTTSTGPDLRLQPGSRGAGARALEKRCRCGRSRGGLGVRGGRTGRPADVATYADRKWWIVNSRNTADEEAVRTLAALAGFTPRSRIRSTSLELVEDLVVAGTASGSCRSDDPPAWRQGRAVDDPEVILPPTR